nr:hypothetical protein Iba_chr05cCG13320 [Ipomoea batatas]
MENSNALSAQRFSEESDLLERSTRKRKVGDGTFGNEIPVPVETPSMEAALMPSSFAAVEVVASTPAVDPPASAMQIEDVGWNNIWQRLIQDLGRRQPGIEDAVVGLGACAEVDDHVAALPQIANPAVEAGAGLPPDHEQPAKRADKQPIVNGLDAMRQSSRSRRANVIVNEQLIANDRATGRAMPQFEKEPAGG